MCQKSLEALVLHLPGEVQFLLSALARLCKCYVAGLQLSQVILHPCMRRSLVMDAAFFSVSTN
jgi:hypothetical protein